MAKTTTDPKQLTDAELVDTYGKLKGEEKALVADVKELNKVIKDRLGGRMLSELAGTKFTVKKSTQDRSTLDKDKLVWRLQELGLDEAIKLVPTPDEEIINRMIFEKRLNPDVLKACMNENIIEVINVSAAKKGGRKK